MKLPHKLSFKMPPISDIVTIILGLGLLVSFQAQSQALPIEVTGTLAQTENEDASNIQFGSVLSLSPGETQAFYAEGYESDFRIDVRAISLEDSILSVEVSAYETGETEDIFHSSALFNVPLGEYATMTISDDELWSEFSVSTDAPSP